ncbi:hypothetical protein COO60DRAFT_1562393, partial [Scenedesmus sp. NREL 46B-D3]
MWHPKQTAASKAVLHYNVGAAVGWMQHVQQIWQHCLELGEALVSLTQMFVHMALLAMSCIVFIIAAVSSCGSVAAVSCSAFVQQEHGVFYTAMSKVRVRVSQQYSVADKSAACGTRCAAACVFVLGESGTQLWPGQSLPCQSPCIVSVPQHAVFFITSSLQAAWACFVLLIQLCLHGVLPMNMAARAAQLACSCAGRCLPSSVATCWQH